MRCAVCGSVDRVETGNLERAGLCLHTIILDPSRTGRIVTAISAASVFRSDDGGKTWTPDRPRTALGGRPVRMRKSGIVCTTCDEPQSSRHTVHQKHWDVMRSDDAGDTWREMMTTCQPISASRSTCTRTSPDRVSCPSKAIRALRARRQIARIPHALWRQRVGAAHNRVPQQDVYLNVYHDAIWSMRSTRVVCISEPAAGGYMSQRTP